MDHNERRKWELRILLEEIEIRNIEQILDLNQHELSEQEINEYLDRISEARRNIKVFRAKLND